ncbi:MULTISPECIES: NAD(P)/FAD-dependent oxidoreductase [Pseudonocardia]|uniref:D-amino acid dehydrogenase small subunit n=2 Tax=Pseudonocardia TaxID=1847 RepID=A0A1Y2N5X0_PSEAH|nr:MULTISPECIES: FAD-dependent oxidoreductase [Pseudonocardia]OSY42856.1 D-amino acid dehydrogenase small subunit [Pseudonocardia autotrophica]TDN77434.1 glycine/D-amino acid oxidase-like deaminating enzyme [Pseudonocardia autotrophica]BBG01457.1 D-amino-acid dehydrogenase [Pseudonocardia autotrophica]GEC25241.1 D-amino-acid dehydrogenase [Pseudonocardia saturnea]
MTDSGRTPAPHRVAVVGAGMIGLSAAWFLRRDGIDVEVFEARTAGSGASWGNAGWLAPALTTPLPGPAVLRTGIRAVFDPSSPVYVPPRADPRLWRFLAGFVRNSTSARRRRGMAAYRAVNELALDAFDEVAAGGADLAMRPAGDFLVCFDELAARGELVAELATMAETGQKVGYDLLDGDEARSRAPMLSGRVAGAIALHDQRFVDPPRCLAGLAGAVTSGGALLREGAAVTGVQDAGDGGVTVRWTQEGRADESRFDAVVLATGATGSELARPFGVRTPVQAGRGYSFSVPVAELPAGPVYLPAQRVAMTPLGDRLRIAGMMEFRAPQEPLDPRRIAAITRAVQPLLQGADLTDRADEWVGSRPCTPDGLPLIGPTRSPRVFVAGGLGMWGMVLGPLTGRLVARNVVTGQVPGELRPFAPTR